MTARAADPNPARVNSWNPPPKEECWEQTVPVPLDEFNLITMRWLEWKGQLVEYAIIHSRKDSDGKWVEVMSIDTMHHGSVHRHNGSHNVRDMTIIRTIDSQLDVQESFETSYAEVYSSYVESAKGSDE